MHISREGQQVTIINVFETRPEHQQELIEQWTDFADSVKGEPGMIGTSLHKSKDGTRVINYAQWRSEEDLNRFLTKYRTQMEVRRQLAQRVDPHLYDVVYLWEQSQQE